MKRIYDGIRTSLGYYMHNVLNDYILNKDFDKNALIIELCSYENELQNIYEENQFKTLAFRFGKDSTIIYTINDLLRDLSNKNHRNYSFLMEAFQNVIENYDNKENEIEIIFN